jgi:DNA polymerase kappa
MLIWICFFCAVEQLDDPTLKDIPFIVGGPVKHGIVSASNYHARKFGIRSGMATFIAVSLCENLKIVNHRGDRYHEVSQRVHHIFRLFDPNYISFGCDEALLEITKLVQTQDSYSVAESLQKEVFERTGLTISIGIAHTSQLAKMASDINKPNDIFIESDDQDEFQQFLNELPIRKIPGVGGSTEQLLHGFEIRKVKDIIEKKEIIWLLFRPKTTEFLFRSALGVPSVQEWTSISNQKSISKETTFDTITNIMDLIAEAEKLANKVYRIAEGQGISFKTVTVKFKSSDFILTTRSFSFEIHTKKLRDLIDESFRLVFEEYKYGYYLKLRRKSYYSSYSFVDVSEQTINIHRKKRSFVKVVSENSFLITPTKPISARLLSIRCI